MRYQGKITSWKDEKGFGFITPNGGGAQVFVHISAFSNKQRRPTGNEIVTYALKTDDKGRAQAEAVSFLGEQQKPTSTRYSNTPLLFVLAFLAFIFAAAFAGKLPKSIFVFYIGASLVSFFVYAWDKSAAMSNRWRTKESTLHLLSLIGGWPGALTAQRFLRHKSKKAEFQQVFWGTVILNCIGLGWLLTSSGSTMFHSIFTL